MKEIFINLRFILINIIIFHLILILIGKIVGISLSSSLILIIFYSLLIFFIFQGFYEIFKYFFNQFYFFIFRCL